ncbi:MAG: 3-dehydroquinate synthase [Crocinitomicaceae bacterium]|nr:3-dehydroquinate synthase [Crocinitomicaceae bacterium]MDG1776971.1 3-dehydroquinate synthase [Crocinitomicaceae bacterium]
MECIDAGDYKIELGGLLASSFEQLLAGYASAKKVIIVDENTHEHCLSSLITSFEALNEAEVILLPEGEENKQMEVAFGVWEALTEYEISRHDLIINLGGGMITDIGGFIASCFKRGCSFVNIPTSLLGMVDASIGGKTGVSLGHFKNQIGVFSNPKAVFIDTSFLETLPSVELYSGLAEMIKHGLIQDKMLFNRVVEQYSDVKQLNQVLLKDCIEVKNTLVKQDPMELGLRKKLNFGHTVGHAIEGHYMNSLKLSHGHAIAIGMLIEAFISIEHASLNEDDFKCIEKFITSNYVVPNFTEEDIDSMVEMLGNDKKNRGGEILTCLIPEIGVCNYDISLSKKVFFEAFKAFKK